MIAQNLQNIRADIERIATGCHRDPSTISLVAVSKRFPVTVMREAMAAGQSLFGENYMQEAVDKKAALGDAIRLHFIGNLQSNKAGVAAQTCAMVETVDRVKIATALDRHLERLDRFLDILVQVNVGREPQKAGVSPDETESLLRRIQGLPRLRAKGLMTMPPFTADPEEVRPYFRTLRGIAEEMHEKGLFAGTEKVELSMGMSHDYPVAIEEGATLIRLGTAIFGPRPAR